MNYKLAKLEGFLGRRGPVLMIVLDGVGIGKKDKGNAFHLAAPKHLQNWMEEARKKRLYTELLAHGCAVGLPTDKDMGNSEVGHNAIGSGQIYHQGARLVNESIQSGRIFRTPVWRKTVGKAVVTHSTVHLLGLLSDGNVHSHIDQLFQLIDGVIASGIKKIRVHVLLDGRDVPPNSAPKYIGMLEKKLANVSAVAGIDARIASGGGRMYITMDRYYSNWSIVKRGWDAHVRGVINEEDIRTGYPGYFLSAKEALDAARAICPEKKVDQLEQFHPPFVIVDKKGQAIGKMKDGDVVINFNFRGDRAIEITEAFVKEDFEGFDRIDYPKISYAGLLEYDSEIHLPPDYLVSPPEINHVSAEFICGNGLTSYAIAETHKFGHVTYFWNGNKSGYIDETLEKYEEIQSEPNEMIEKNPAMKAKEVTEKLLLALQSKKYQFLRVNYANGDMVGHTGNIDSCIQAVKTLDDCLPAIVDEVVNQKGIVVISADHGNVEEKLDKKGRTKTSHTLNPVPFFILDGDYKGEYTVDVSTIENPGIANIAATLINLLGFVAPDFYEKSLIRIADKKIKVT